MKKLFSILYLTTCVTMLFSQGHNHDHDGHNHSHDDTQLNECIESKKVELKAYAEEQNWENQFYSKYSISQVEFAELNVVHTAAIQRRVLKALCDESLKKQDVLPFVFDYIDNRMGDLLFARPMDLLPGQVSYGKNYLTPRTGEPTNTNNRGPGEPCNNVDFETGDFTGWEVFCANGNNQPFGVINMTPYTPGSGGCGGTATEPALVVGPGTDPNVPIQMVNPNGGGNYSVLIGDYGAPAGAFMASVIRQTFEVDQNSELFTYSYAAVMDNINHSANDQPFFRVRVYDDQGNDLSCGRYEAYANDGQSGWQTQGSHIYLNWVTVFIPLNNYVGDVTVEIATGDCTVSGGNHKAYAYFDASCTSLGIAASQIAICDGQSVTLDAPTGGSSYSWSPGGQTTSSIVISDPGTYEVTIVPVSGDPTCAVTVPITVDAGPGPTADFTAAPMEVCQFDAIEFTDNSDPGPGETISTWEWDFGYGQGTAPGSGPITSENFTSGSYNNPTHNFQSDGTHTVSLTVTNSVGCQSTTQIDILTNPLPIIDGGPNIDECQNVPIILEGSGGVSYIWDNNVVDGEEFFPPVGTTVYTVTGVDANGCESTANVTLNIDAAPQIDAGPDQAICLGDGVTLSASGASDYVWSDGVVDGVTFTPTQTTTYTVTYTSPLGCTGIDSVTVVVNPLPNITANSPVVCVGQSVTLLGSGGTSYTWSDGIVNGLPFTPPLPGTTSYTVTGTDANGCQNSAVVTVTVIAYPNASFTASPETGIPGTEVDIVNQTTGATDYFWNFGNGNTSTDNFDVNTQYYPEAGNPAIILIASNQGCNDTAIVILDIKYTPMSYNIPNVFTPNNDGDNDYFHLSLVNVAEVELLIFNRWGNLMAEIRDVNHPGWDGRMSTGGDASEGVYFHRYRIVALDGEIAEGHGFLHLVR